MSQETIIQQAAELPEEAQQPPMDMTSEIPQGNILEQQLPSESFDVSLDSGENEDEYTPKMESPVDDTTEEVSLDNISPTEQEATNETPWYETLGEAALDTIQAPINGLNSAINGVLDLGYSTVKFGYDAFTKGWDEAEFKDEDFAWHIPMFQMDTTAGELIEGFSKFAFGFAGAGKIGLLKKAANAPKYINYLKLVARGFVADMATQKAGTENFTNLLINKYPSLRNPLTEFMASDSNDEHISNRLKKAMEGVALGPITDGAIAFLRLGKNILFNQQSATNAVSRYFDDIRDAVTRRADTPTLPNPNEQYANTAARMQLTMDSVFNELRAGRDWKDVMNRFELQELQQLCATNPQVLDQLHTFTSYNMFSLTPEGRNFLKGIAELIEPVVKPESFDDFIHDTAKTYERLYGNVPKEQQIAIWTASLHAGGDELKRLRQTNFMAREYINSAIPHLQDVVTRLAADEARAAAGQVGRTAEEIFNDEKIFVHLALTTQHLIAAQKHFNRETARTLGSLRVPLGEGKFDKLTHYSASFDPLKMLDFDVDVLKMDTASFDTFLTNLGWTRKDMQRVVDSMTAIMDGDAMLHQLKLMGTPSWNRTFSFYWSHNILSGWNTQVLNAEGNFLNLNLKGLTRFIGSLHYGVRNQDAKELASSIRFAKNLYMNLGSSFLRGIRMGITGEQSMLRFSNNYLDSHKFGGFTFNQPLPTSRESWEQIMKIKHPDGNISMHEKFLGNMFHYLGMPARATSRAMMSVDEAFRADIFIAEQRAQIERELENYGIKRGTPEWERRYKEMAAEFFTPHGFVDKSNPLAVNALDMANRGVWAEDLTSKYMQGFQLAAESNIAVKMILPFIKTVHNVARDCMQYIPGINYMLSKDYRMAWRGEYGVSRQVEAYGKFWTGLGACALAYIMADNGTITGSLSNIPKVREAQQRSGKQFYSMKIGDSWVNYQRDDPLAAIFGTVADLQYLIFNSEELTDKTIFDYSLAVIAAFTTVIADKSFLTGVKDLCEALWSKDKTPGESVGEYVGKQLQGFIPGVNFMNQTYQAIDRDQRQDERYLWDTFERMGMTQGAIALLQKIGIEAKNTPLRYDWITGEPIQKIFRVSDDKAYQDYVFDELERQAPYLYQKPQRTLGTVELNAEQYSRFCQLHGTVKNGEGKTQYEALKDIMDSPQYDLNREHQSDDSVIMDEESTPTTFRANMLRGIEKQFRTLAKEQLYREYPEILERILHDKHMKALQANPSNFSKSSVSNIEETLDDSLAPFTQF